MKNLKLKSIILIGFCGLAIAGPLNDDVMDQLASQIPIPTTPTQMHKAVIRYTETVEMFEKEAYKYKKECYKVFFRRHANSGSKLIMLHGFTPDQLCAYLSDRLRRGYPVPEVQMILNDIDD
jgi:hypothetical protein